MNATQNQVLTTEQVSLFAKVLGGYKPQPQDATTLGQFSQAAMTLAALPEWERTAQAYDVLFNSGATVTDIQRIYSLTSTPQALATVANGLATIRGEDLYNRQFPPREFLWDGYIARGHCVVFAGRPKSGKSWFTLQLAQAVDTGKPFLGRPTVKASVLYMALEDGERRIHERLHVRNWQPQNTSFAFNCLPFDNGGAGLEQIKTTAGPYDMVIIDTLIKTLTGRTDEKSNTAMAEIMNTLTDYAHNANKALIVNHHTRKPSGTSDDPFDDIRGAGSIRGAYDVGIVITRKPKEAEAVLSVESRDLDAEDMTVKFDGATGWGYEGNGATIEGIRVGKKVLKALAEIGDGATTSEIAKHLNTPPKSAWAQLSTAEKRGLIYSKPDDKPAKDGKPELLWFTKA